MQCLCGLHIGLLLCLLLQVIEGDALAQEGVCIGQAGQLVERCHDILGAVDALDATGFAGVGFVTSEQARSMKVEERVEDVAAKGVEGGGMVLRDMFVAKQLAHDAAVLGFGQAVVPRGQASRSLLWRGRLRVNSTWSLPRSLATL